MMRTPIGTRVQLGHLPLLINQRGLLLSAYRVSPEEVPMRQRSMQPFGRLHVADFHGGLDEHLGVTGRQPTRARDTKRRVASVGGSLPPCPP